jgi:hypothetical protein
MDFDITQGIGVLERMPGTLHAMLHDLGAEWIDATEGPETWSPHDIVGHLVHGEHPNWIPRARFILSGPWRAYLPIVDR